MIPGPRRAHAHSSRFRTAINLLTCFLGADGKQGKVGLTGKDGQEGGGSGILSVMIGDASKMSLSVIQKIGVGGKGGDGGAGFPVGVGGKAGANPGAPMCISCRWKFRRDRPEGSFWQKRD